MTKVWKCILLLAHKGVSTSVCTGTRERQNQPSLPARLAEAGVDKKLAAWWVNISENRFSFSHRNMMSGAAISSELQS